MVVRKDIPFKKKSKPGLGESKECKRGDMMVVTRSQDRKYLGKLIRPVVASDYLQPRLGGHSCSFKTNLVYVDLTLE